MKKITKQKIIRITIITISCFIIGLTIYLKKTFTSAAFEQLFYSLYTSGGSSIHSFYEGAIFTLSSIAIVFILLKIINVLYEKIASKKKINLFIFSEKWKNIFSIIFLVFAITLIVCKLGALNYLVNQTKTSTIFEEYYVNGKDIEIKFPEKKQNLIYIFVESLENTVAAKENGGAEEKTFIPHLEKLALENTNFSNTNKLGGAYQVYGTTWTVAAMIGQTSGVPLKISLNKNNYNGNNDFLPGVYSLGEILEDNGYKNYLMLGSKVSFGGREDYFKKNGNYQMYDYEYALENDWIPDDYNVWWGYEDSKLYSFAQDKLLEISKEEPFNFTLLTADTHFIDGYIDEACETPFSNHYANSFHCTDEMLNEFINWVKKQDFYENTTIVIVGDHFTMQEELYDNIDSKYQRTIYNTIINSKIESSNSKERKYTSFDYFPTTLAALGVEIEGNRLGLGTNLFSDKKTLVEEIGLKKLNDELKKKSNYYDQNIIIENINN